MNKKSIVLSIATLLSLSGISSADYVIQFNNSQSKGMIPEVFSKADGSSCKDILDNGKSTGNGIYTINVNSKEFDVYCDMTSAGGGWTMVVAQFEQDPVTNWNEGIQADYDPSLFRRKGFALNSQELPSHTQTAFGKSLDADFVDYISNVYSAGNINSKSFRGFRTGKIFQIHRDINYFFGNMDPETTLYSLSKWNNTLTFDEKETSRTWAFSPNHDSEKSRGYGMKGEAFTSNDSYSWTVWVR